MAPWKPASGARLRFLRQELPPAVPSCQFWVNRSELYLGSPSLTILQKQLPRLHRFDLTHQTVNISDKRNTNTGERATQWCRPCHSCKCVWKDPGSSPLGPTCSEQVGCYPRTVHSLHFAGTQPILTQSWLTGQDINFCSPVEPKGEWAAVGLWQEGKGLKLCWAKDHKPQSTVQHLGSWRTTETSTGKTTLRFISNVVWQYSIY